MVIVQDALRQHADVYKPMADDFKTQLQLPNVDDEVQQALIAQLLGPARVEMPAAPDEGECGG